MKIPRIARLVIAALAAAPVFFVEVFTVAAETKPVTKPLAPPAAQFQPSAAAKELVKLLDAPLLFVKRHSYTGIHIYDTYYKWPPGGGGIYVLENPQAPRAEWKIRPVIDPTTPGTLGEGVYTHPELSWDATKLLFCFKGKPDASTCIYEIGIDGQGLRRVANPALTCVSYKGAHSGQHDIAPAYLPDGRIVFLSTRPSGLVPCANEGVSILHVMNADGSDLHPISVNNVNEFDPSVLPDGRIVFGRWEYVDKNALTIQSLWTVHPDGTEETALFANNMVFPEAILDARPVPNSHLIVGTFAKHNAPPRGSIAFIDPRLGKNGPQAIVNLEHPDKPTTDTGDSCEPWPISENVVLFSGRPAAHKRNVLELMDRAGHRFVLMSDTNICLHSPMLVKARPVPSVIQPATVPGATTGRFFVQDIYQGLDGVKRGEVKSLRVIEETSRVSATHSGANPYNQTFLVSAALAFSVKNYLGVVPVDEKGSAYFEAPSGRALYLQALDGEGRLVQSMRTFVQAAPGVTRSCIGCHEHKAATPVPGRSTPEIARGEPSRPQPESWGSGFMDYPSLVQPILDKHCVSCHGGKKGIAAGLDLSGGWTEHFNISYENLVNRRESQLEAYWIAGIDCMNGTAHGSSQLLPPRRHGSGAAPLAQLLMSGHGGRLGKLTRPERDLLMAWIDSNGLYHGSWDYSPSGCATPAWKSTKQRLVSVMESAGCAKCHGGTNGIARFESDWFNLREPEFSRILRAPLPKDAKGYGLGLCRDRKVDAKQQRIRLLVDGYAHAVKPVQDFPRRELARGDTNSASVVSFTSVKDAPYQKMLAAIRRGRDEALAAPRVDMPGAEVIAGASRQFVPPPVPATAPTLKAVADDDGVVHLAWERSARTIGLEAELHRSAERNFTPSAATLVVQTNRFDFSDKLAPKGRQHYALVLVADAKRSQPSYASVAVPRPTPPRAPAALQATPASCSIRLQWEAPSGGCAGYHVYRRPSGSKELQKLTAKPVRLLSFTDSGLETRASFDYVVRAVSARGLESKPTKTVTASAVVIQEPVFTAALGQGARGILYDGESFPAAQHDKARCADGILELKDGGHLTFPHRSEFELGQPLSIECWVWLDQPGKSPVLVSCGEWRGAGWFLQRLGERWRWHVGGVDCDGGKTAVGRWVHLAAIYDGQNLRLFEDGAQVAEAKGPVKTDAWPGELHIGQYSASPGDDFRVTGRIAGVKIYHRPLAAAELAEAAKKKPEKL
ncbi:MAG: PD40 domain-containing protein [Verrucomicrobia bacterium]|nr:PD40 domain-containing protein [Verrucomicrobiota bacterium]